MKILQHMRGSVWSGILALIVLFLPVAASAGSISTWNWTGLLGSETLSGSADFSTVSCGINCYDLKIVLANDALVAPEGIAWGLGGLLFDISGTSGGLGMRSATADLGLVYTSGPLAQTNLTQPTFGTAGANICAPGTSGGLSPTCSTAQTGGWQTAYNSTGLGSFSQEYGIGTVGMNIFNGNNVGDANYEIVPGGGIGATTLDGFKSKSPFVYGEATFFLYGLDTSDIAISNVLATYGTQPEATFDAFDPPPITHAPEPVSLVLMGTGLLMVGRAARKKLKR